MISIWLLLISAQVKGDPGCKVVHDFPSCKPNCLVNNGGCPNNINCHQVPDRIYKVNNVCYQALTGCFNCLEMGPNNYPRALNRLDSCDVIAQYPSCGQNCLTNYGGCPNGNCHQVRDRIYEVNGECYQAISNCWGCLPYPHNYPTHLRPLSECAIVHDFPSCKPNCLVNNGGCPHGPCHQIQNDIYRVAGQCYQAISGCYGCLEMGPTNYPQHLRALGSCTSASSCDALQSAVVFIAPPLPPHSLYPKSIDDNGKDIDDYKYYFGIKFTKSDQILLQLIATTLFIVIICGLFGVSVCCKARIVSNKGYKTKIAYVDAYDSEQDLQNNS